jgi:acyl dehydratase
LVPTFSIGLRSLAGGRGKEIVAKLPKWFLGAWTAALHTVIIDDFIATALQDGVDTVLNLGAGISGERPICRLCVHTTARDRLSRVGSLERPIMTISGDVGGDDSLYLDDLQVGQRFTSKTHVVDAAQIKAFARKFDPQPFHLDDDAAKDSLFSGLVASGRHTAAITMRLLVERGLPLAGGVVGAGGELSWPRPTRPGDVLQVESEVLEVIPSRSRPDRGVATIRSLTRNQRDEVVQILTAKLIVPRRTHQ